MHTIQNPAQDAVKTLRRIGLLALFLVATVASFEMRRALVVLVPAGVILLTLSYFLDPERRNEKEWSEKIFSGRRFSGLLLIFLIYAASSLLWTSSEVGGLDRIMRLSSCFVLFLFALVAIPQRSRLSDALLIGWCLVFAVAYGLARISLQNFLKIDDILLFERTALILSATTWPIMGIFLSRYQLIPMLFVLVTGILISFLVLGAYGLFMMSLALAVFLVARNVSPQIMRIIALGAVFLLLFWPLFLWMADWWGMDAISSIHELLTRLTGDPFAFIFGQGIEATRNLAKTTSTHALFSIIWIELGLIGACLLALIIMAIAQMITRLPADVMAAASASMMYVLLAFNIMDVGLQTWWITSLVLLGIAHVLHARASSRLNPPL